LDDADPTVALDHGGSMTSELRMRMHPDDTFLPIVQGSFEPWMRVVM
jgi:hypothetical protein